MTVVAAPVITSFVASPAAVKQGSPSSLTAVFTGGTGSIDNGVGSTTSGASKVVTPALSTVYKLTVTNSLGTSVTATAAVTVFPLVSISIAPTSATIPVGSQGRFTATGTYSDNSTANLTNLVTWSSSNTAIATVNTVGLVTGTGAGTATITAALGAISGTATVTVTAVSGTAGRFVYAANVNSSSVSGFILDQTTGALTSVPASPVSTTYPPYSVASHPSGRFVYAGNSYGVTGFASNATTGQLTAIPGGNPFFNSANSSFSGGPIYAVAADPAGRFVYAVNYNTAELYAYQVDGNNGALTQVGTYATGQCSRSMTVDASGKFVYVVNECGTTAGVWAYGIDADTGRLTMVSGSPFGGVQATSITAAPNGQVLYAITNSAIRGYTINSTTGALTLLSGFPVSTPVCCTNYSGLVTDPAGRFLYAVTTSGSVSAYRIDAVTGGITAITGSPFALGATNTQSAAIDASGKFIYISSYTGSGGSPGAVAALAINQATGALTVAPGSPFVTGGSQAYAVATTGAIVSSSATLQSIEIIPGAPTILSVTVGVKLQLTLLGHYSDGTTQFLTESAAWSSSVPGKATISNSAGTKGLATSTGFGSTVITATHSGLTATATLTVQQPALVSIAITPSAPTIASGTAIQFTAVATYSDNSTQSVTTAATWSSSDTTVASVSNAAGSQGLATAIAAGTSTIAATFNGASGSAALTVTAVTPSAGRFVYAVNQNGLSVSSYVLDQQTGALAAVPGSPTTGLYSTPYSVTSHPSGRFVYVGHPYGVTGFSSNAVTGQLTVIPGGYPYFGYTGTSPNPLPFVYALAIEPSGRFVYTANGSAGTVSAYVVDAGNGALTPVGTYASGQCPRSLTVDPSGKFVYVPNECGTTVGVWVYAIDGTTGALTLVPGSPFGSAVTAVATTPNGQVLYTINSSSTIRGYTINGATGALTAIAGFPVTTPVCCTYYGGLTVDPTGRFLYAAANGGSVTAYTINGTTGGLTAVSGSPFTLGTTNTFHTAVDGSGKYLYVSGYANTSPNVGAVVALAINQTTGALTAAPGSPYAAGNQTFGITTTAAVMASATLQSIEISPATPTISTAVLGTKLQLRLIGHYSDGTTQFLTESGTWSSSVTGTATISNAAGSKGLTTSTGYGSTTITATYSGFTATATLTVQQPTVVSIAITPSSPTIANGTAIQFTAVATYSDGTTQTITSVATWSSSDQNVATVSNVAGSRGLTTAVAPGTSTIAATFNGVNGSGALTVAAVAATVGRFVYTTNQNGLSVSGYVLDQQTGALAAVPGSPTTGLYSTPYSVTSHPSGRFVYVGHPYGVTGFSSNAVTGQLTVIPGGYPYFGYTGTSPNPLPYVYGLAVEPSGRFVYTADNNAGTVSAYVVDAGNGALTPVGTYASGQCPRSLTVDPSGKFVYVPNECGTTVGVWVYAIDGTTGALTLVPGSPFGSAVTAVATTPNGQVLYTINSSSTIRGYTINGATGALTAIAGFPVTTPVCCTYYGGLTVDPTGRFLYAAANGGSVTAYTINGTTGGLTAVSGSPFTLGTINTFHTAVDGSGKYLYVSGYASTSPNVGAVVATGDQPNDGGAHRGPRVTLRGGEPDVWGHDDGSRDGFGHLTIHRDQSGGADDLDRGAGDQAAAPTDRPLQRRHDPVPDGIRDLEFVGDGHGHHQ